MRAFAERLDAGLAALTEEHARFERALELIGSSTVMGSKAACARAALRGEPEIELFAREPDRDLTARSNDEHKRELRTALAAAGDRTSKP